MRAARQFMSIGEVLDSLKSDFPDVSISKIRFLESAGLIETERTPAGYRKFYPQDVDRLRFILTLQRDSYLPLKVIKERLSEYDAGILPPEPAAVESKPVASESGPEDDLAEPPTALHLSESELCQAAGLEPGHVRSLKEFGVICEHRANGVEPYFDGDDLVIGRIARDFIRFGIEPRHLKMFRHFAEREAALIEQVVLPTLKHPSPEARQKAKQSLSELAALSRKLRHAFLRQNLRSYLSKER